MNLILFFLLVLPVFNSYASDSNYCAIREKYYQKEKFSLENGISQLDLNDTSIIYFGEPHLNFGLELYPQILNNLEKNGFHPDCYLLEADQEQELVEKLNQLNTLVNTSDFPSLKDHLFPGIYEIVIEMHKRGMKIFAVDNHKGITSENLFSMLNNRDKHMANEIEKLKESGVCNKIVYPVGALHISSKFNPGRRDLGFLLKKKGYKSLSINIDLQGLTEKMDTGIGLGGLPVLASTNYAWLPSIKRIDTRTVKDAQLEDFACTNNPKITKTPYIIFPNETDLFGFDNYINPKSSYSDFDISITYSCQKNDCRKDNLFIQKTLKKIGLRFY